MALITKQVKVSNKVEQSLADKLGVDSTAFRRVKWVNPNIFRHTYFVINKNKMVGTLNLFWDVRKVQQLIILRRFSDGKVAKFRTLGPPTRKFFVEPMGESVQVKLMEDENDFIKFAEKAIKGMSEKDLSEVTEYDDLKVENGGLVDAIDGYKKYTTSEPFEEFSFYLFSDDVAPNIVDDYLKKVEKIKPNDHGYDALRRDYLTIFTQNADKIGKAFHGRSFEKKGIKHHQEVEDASGQDWRIEVELDVKAKVKKVKFDKSDDAFIFVDIDEKITVYP